MTLTNVSAPDLHSFRKESLAASSMQHMCSSLNLASRKSIITVVSSRILMTYAHVSGDDALVRQLPHDQDNFAKVSK